MGRVPRTCRTFVDQLWVVRSDVEMGSIRETLKRVEIAAAAKDVELEERAHRIARVISDMDTMRIEAMSRDTEIDTLLSRADQAMYTAKANGRAQLVLA